MISREVDLQIRAVPTNVIAPAPIRARSPGRLPRHTTGHGGRSYSGGCATLPVARTAQRLRWPPRRPRPNLCSDNPGDNREPARTQVRVPPGRPAARTQDSPSCAPPGPQLLTRQQAADYLNLSSDMLDRLTQQGELPRVQLLLGNRNVRKVLYDRADLDRLVELSRIV